jgi:K+-transporting ATPase A subunit
MTGEVILAVWAPACTASVVLHHRGFHRGLMVGRTPEYLGKKIEQKKKMAMLAIIATALASWCLVASVP